MPSVKPARRKAPRTRDAVRTRAALLAAAREEFMEKGFDGARTSALAKRAGVPQGLIYHYFAHKKALFSAVLEEAFHPYFESTVESLRHAEAGGAELLAKSIRDYFDFLADNPHVPRLMAWWTASQGWTEGAPLKDHELCTLPMTLGAQRIREGQEAGVIARDVDPMAVIGSFLDLCMSWHLNLTRTCDWRGVDPSDAEAVAELNHQHREYIVRLVLRGIAPLGE